MRARHSGWQRPHAGYAAHAYPAPSDRHPTYMFGHFDRDLTALDPGRGLDEALLRLTEASRSAGVAGHAHRHGHRPGHGEITAAEGPGFMFGGDALDPRAMPSGEPVYYFWAAGMR